MQTTVMPKKEPPRRAAMHPKAKPHSGTTRRGRGNRTGHPHRAGVSGENFADGLAPLRDRHGTARAVGHHRLRIDAETGVNGGTEVGRPYWSVLDIGRVRVARPADRAAPDPRTGQDDRVTVRPVI